MSWTDSRLVSLRKDEVRIFMQLHLAQRLKKRVMLRLYKQKLSRVRFLMNYLLDRKFGTNSKSYAKYLNGR